MKMVSDGQNHKNVVSHLKSNSLKLAAFISEFLSCVYSVLTYRFL
jgi:hypothetical protein